MDKFFKYMQLVGEVNDHLMQAKMRAYELKGRLEAQKDPEDLKHFQLTLNSEIRTNCRSLSRELSELKQELEKLID